MYFLFSRYEDNETWYFLGEFEDIEKCEQQMTITEEYVAIEYKIIKGTELEYEDLPALFPFKIIE